MCVLLKKNLIIRNRDKKRGGGGKGKMVIIGCRNRNAKVKWRERSIEGV
jgi:hypothetical protein